MAQLSIKDTVGKGRGVFTIDAIPAQALIESCEVLVVPADERARIDTTVLYNYYFGWGAERTEGAIALGCGSLYNHSYQPNARYEKDLINRRISFFALRAIAAGEEITVNYNGTPEDRQPVWFPVSE